MKKADNGIFKALSLLTQLGLSMIAPIVLCVVLGSWLDDRMGWHVTLPLLVLGILAGFRNCYMLVRSVERSSYGSNGDEKKKTSSKDESNDQ